MVAPQAMGSAGTVLPRQQPEKADREEGQEGAEHRSSAGQRQTFANHSSDTRSEAEPRGRREHHSAPQPERAARGRGL